MFGLLCMAVEVILTVATKRVALKVPQGKLLAGASSTPG